jgi:hypothetical protein
MASDDLSRTGRRPPVTNGFRLSGGPVAYLSEDQDSGSDLVELSQLPRVYGEPILFAIARDPRTLFVYWNIDWAAVFKAGEPLDRQIFLRVKKAGGAEESESVIEPLLGSYYAPVSQPRGTYRVEIGFYPQAGGAWRSIATSDEVAMPPENASEKVDVDVATIPFHVSFQRIVDLFENSKGTVLSESISDLQERAAHEESVTPEEKEILRAMNLSLPELDAARRDYLETHNRDGLQKKLEAILGFGGSSPSRAFGGSSP